MWVPRCRAQEILTRPHAPVQTSGRSNSSADVGMSAKSADPKGLVARLRRELAATQARLDSVSEELATSSEELQSSNEELQSSNEELQSSNEELESAGEELRASNEELAEVNAELVKKMLEVTRSSDDVANLLASSDIATLLLDSELRISRFTPAATSIFSIQARDRGRPVAELSMVPTYPRFLADARAVAEGGAAVETHIRDASERVFIARVAPYRTHEGYVRGVVATFVDVTSLELARSALRDNAEQLRELFDHVAIGIAVTDLRGWVVDANPALCAMLQSPREELVGHPFGFRPQTDGEGRSRQLHDDLLAGKRQHYDVEEHYQRADGTTLWARVSVSVIKAGSGSSARAVHVVQDVSEAKRNEKQLRAQEGIARLGEMAAAIAHEVRSPLVAILGAVDVLSARLPSGVDDGRVVDEIRQRIASVDALVTELLLFARPKELKFTRVPILRLLQDTAGLLRVSRELGDVELTIIGDEAEVLGDVELLKSVFVNLATNAAQAMKGRGEFRVEVRGDGSATTILFTDTGPGIPETLANQIFEPFFTTKSRGIGLGLALAKRIVEAHGGDIALLPSEGRGATLSVTLPNSRS